MYCAIQEHTCETAIITKAFETGIDLIYSKLVLLAHVGLANVIKFGQINKMAMNNPVQNFLSCCKLSVHYEYTRKYLPAMSDRLFNYRSVSLIIAY